MPQDYVIAIDSGTVNVGTVAVSSLPSGGTILNLAAGTLTLVSTVTTVSNQTNGTTRISVGTVTTGTLQNLVTGTINALASGTVTAGTLTNLVSGTINALAAGTITGGTIQNLNAGTVLANSPGFTYSHLGGAGTTAIKVGAGTLHTVVINSKSVGGVASLYDSNGTGGALIAAIDTTLSTTAFIYDIAFGSLTIAHVGATGGDITTAYK